MSTKICGECKLEKEISNYRLIKEKRTKKVSEYICSKCKNCEKKRALANYYSKREEYNIKNKDYKKNNKDKINETRRKYTRSKMKNPDERLKRNLKTLLCIKLKNNKTQKSSFYLGEDLINIKNWLEFNWDEYMTWENYGNYWEIDHSIPIHCFDMKNSKDVKVCFCWMNLMPLEKKLNLKKSTKILINRILYQEIKLRFYCNKVPELKNKIEEYIKDYNNKFVSQYK